MIDVIIAAAVFFSGVLFSEFMNYVEKENKKVKFKKGKKERW